MAPWAWGLADGPVELAEGPVERAKECFGAGIVRAGGGGLEACTPSVARWSGRPSCGVRFGEAANPGHPHLRLLVANVTSWRGSWRGLVAAGADVYCVQEARVPDDNGSVAAAVDGARRRGLRMQLGAAGDGTHLLAFVHREGLHGLRAVGMVGLAPEQARRLQYAVLHLGGHRALHIVQVYGHADGLAAADDNEALLIAAVSWLRSLGGVPALLVGDFNLVLRGTSVEPLLAMAGWRDLLARAGPTCLPSSGNPSRIDHVLANGATMEHVVTAGLRWDLGLATHAALEVELAVEAPERAAMRRRPSTLAGPASDGWPAARQAVTDEVAQEHGEAFRAGLHDGRLDAAWRALEAAMRQWLSRRSGHMQPVERWYAATRWQASRPRATGVAGEASDVVADAALLRLRRLRSMQHAAGRWGLGCHPAQSVVAALCRDEAAGSAWLEDLPRLTTTPGLLQVCIQRADLEHQEAQKAARSRRRDSWREWSQQALANGGGRLYRWIRADDALAADLVPAPLGVDAGAADAALGGRRWCCSLRGGGAAAQLRHFEHHWRALWQRSVPAMPRVEDWLVELDSLPPFPDRVPWTADLVRAVLQGMAKSKAPGLDAWTVAELCLLPPVLLEWIAELFESVERAGRWPAELSQPEGLLLPKPGDGGPWTGGLYDCFPCCTASGRRAGRSCSHGGARPGVMAMAVPGPRSSLGPWRSSLRLRRPPARPFAGVPWIGGRPLTTSACSCWSASWCGPAFPRGCAAHSLRRIRRLAGYGWAELSAAHGSRPVGSSLGAHWPSLC